MSGFGKWLFGFCISENVDTRWVLLLRGYVVGLIFSPLLSILANFSANFPDNASEFFDTLFASVFGGVAMIFGTLSWPFFALHSFEEIFYVQSGERELFRIFFPFYSIVPLILFPVLAFVPRSKNGWPLMIPLSGVCMFYYFAFLAGMMTV